MRIIVPRYIVVFLALVLFKYSFAAAEPENPSEVPPSEKKIIQPDAQIASDAIDPANSAEEEVTVVGDESAKITVGDRHLEPSRVQVSPGTTIVWVNRSAEDILVRFTGKAVSTTCKAPRGFQVGTTGVYVSQRISHGEVASLCFLEPELYVYEVSFMPANLSEDDPNKPIPQLVLGSVHVVK